MCVGGTGDITTIMSITRSGEAMSAPAYPTPYDYSMMQCEPLPL